MSNEKFILNNSRVASKIESVEKNNEVTISEVQHKVIKENDSTIHLYTCQIGGYRIERDLIEFDNNSTRERIDIYAEKKYLPNIIFNRRRNGEKVSEFKIDTVSYGSLYPDELKNVIDGYNHAIQVVEILNNEFLGEVSQ